jgi:hypothetical protein
MALCPVLAGWIAPAMTQQEGEQLLAGTHEVHGSIDSRADQVPKCFVSRVGNPHRR